MLRKLKFWNKGETQEEAAKRFTAKIEDLKEQLEIAKVKLRGADEEICDLEVQRDQLKSGLRDMTLDRDRNRERNTKLEIDARAIAVDGLVLRAHEIKRDTRVLIISTPNVTLLNHGSFANLMNRLQNVCKHLDMIAMFHGDIQMDNVNEQKAIEKYHMVLIPTKNEWYRDRTGVIERVSKVFDERAK